MRLVCARGVATPRDQVLKSNLFQNWARRLPAKDVGTVVVNAAWVWGGEVRMLQLGVEYGDMNHAVFLRGATVDMLTVLTDGRNRHVVLARQPRVAVGQEVVSNPSGMVDTGESLVVTALRELDEEVGRQIRWGRPVNLNHEVLGMGPLLVSPGGTDEEVTFFVVHGSLHTTTLADLLSRVTGKREEGERIRLSACAISDRYGVTPVLQALAGPGTGRADLKAVTSLMLYQSYLTMAP